jgi:hypothetical protein
MSDFFGNLAGLFTGSTGVDAAKQSAAAATQAAKKSAKKQTQLVGPAYDTGIASYQQSLAPWQTIFNQGKPAVETYYGALGQGTPEQVDAARNQFTASPGYEYTLGQGLEGLGRVGASVGQFGQADMNAMDYAHNLSNQDFQQWLTNLSHGFGQETAGALGQSNAYGQIGGAQIGKGKSLADIQAQKYATIGQAQSALPQNIYAAESGGASNTLNALFSIAELGMSGGMSGLFGGGAPSIPESSWSTVGSTPDWAQGNWAPA